MWDTFLDPQEPDTAPALDVTSHFQTGEKSVAMFYRPVLHIQELIWTRRISQCEMQQSSGQAVCPHGCQTLKKGVAFISSDGVLQKSAAVKPLLGHLGASV